MTKLEIYDNINLLSERLADIRYLEQKIREDFFEKYDGDNQEDTFRIAYEFNRYASLYRILGRCLFESGELLKEILKAVKENE